MFSQRIANAFPEWTKVRHDPSSEGGRLISSFGELLAGEYKFLNLLKEEKDILRKRLGRGQLYTVVLDEADHFQFNQISPILNEVIYPTVTGDRGTGALTLTRKETIEEFLSCEPTDLSLVETISVGGTLVWESAALDTYNAIPRPERLCINVENSTEYFKRTKTRNLNKTGNHFVSIEGLDLNDINFKERIEINDDGTYWTRNIVKKLLKVTWEGFNGSAKIFWFPNEKLYVEEKGKLMVTMDLEGNLKWRLSDNTLEAFTDILKAGSDYRKQGIPLVENIEVGYNITMLNLSGNPYQVIDFAINEENGLFYCLSDDQKVFVYQITEPHFLPLIEEETDMTYVELKPQSHWAKFGGSEFLGTSFQRMRFPISRVRIKRTDPAGIIRYLQADKTWGPSSYWFSGRPDKEIEESWQDIMFFTEYNQIGQWEYVCEVETTKDTTKYVTAVLVIGTQPLVELVVGAGENITFSHDNYLVLLDNSLNEIKLYKEFFDFYYANVDTNEIILLENYSTVTVT